MPHKLDLGGLPDEHKLTDMTEFRSKVGALMYAAHCVRSDACGPVQQFSRYLHAATPTMLTHLNNTLKYFLATADIGLTYDGKKPGPVYGYSNADWAGDATTRRSTSGYVFMRNNAAVTWSSLLHPSVAHMQHFRHRMEGVERLRQRGPVASKARKRLDRCRIFGPYSVV